MPFTSSLPFRSLSVAAVICALLFAFIGYFGPNIVDNALHKGILQNIVWRPNSPPEVDARFRGDPMRYSVPDYFKVWMWNLTNLAEVRKGAKPKMSEVGPLTYVKTRVRLAPQWDRNGRVAVKEWDYYTFVPELSGASPYEEIVTLNLPLVGVLEVLHSYSSTTVRPLLDVLVGVLSKWQDHHVDGLFMKRTAGELVWGYEDLLLQRLALVLGSTFVKSSRVQLLKNDSLEVVQATKGVNIIDTGWRPAGMYDGIGGRTTLAQLGGRRSGRRLGKAQRSEYDEERIWNMEMESGWREVSSWGPNCSEPVRGTDAFQFRPGLNRSSILRVWIAELFRSAKLLHVADEELHGIRLLRFIPNPQEAEIDACHHQFVRGLANVTVPMAVGPNGNGSSEAAHGVPILMSLPHYCLVDESVPDALEGMSCDPYRHGIFLDVEPTSGITMRAAKRLQLSSQLTASARVTLEPNIGASLILPIFWAEEASEISDTQAAAFRNSVYRAQHIAVAIRSWSYPAAAAMAVLALAALAAVRLAEQQPRRHQGQGQGGSFSTSSGEGADASGGAGNALEGTIAVATATVATAAALPTPQAATATPPTPPAVTFTTSTATEALAEAPAAAYDANDDMLDMVEENEVEAATGLGGWQMEDGEKG